MKIKTPFFIGFSPTQLKTFIEHSKETTFEQGDLLFQEGQPADSFFVILKGRVSLEIHSPNKGSHIIQTLHSGDVIGWSWMVAPYTWRFDGTVLEKSQVLVVDGKFLREECETDHDFGYMLLKKVSQIFVNRLAAARIQLLDLYKEPGEKEKIK